NWNPCQVQLFDSFEICLEAGKMKRRKEPPLAHNLRFQMVCITGKFSFFEELNQIRNYAV
ncbi:MAG: hypothetical protein IKS32_08965, partial [Solobacterium sp.]|nr:hypothetical protein [Solobacterium sp.]